MATEKQAQFIIRLSGELGINPDDLGIPQMTVKTASAIIKTLLERVEAVRATKPAPKPAPKTSGGLHLTVPGGCYAVPGEDGKLRFLSISAPDHGKWAGWYFVSVQAGDDTYRLGSQRPGQSYQGKSANLLETVQRDPQGASAAYGRELGVCGVCGRTLTDEVSRERGIGPICYEKF